MPKLLDLAHRSIDLCMRPRVPRFATKRLETIFDTLSNVYLAAHDGLQLPLLKSDLLLAVMSHQPTIHASVLRVLLAMALTSEQARTFWVVSPKAVTALMGLLPLHVRFTFYVFVLEVWGSVFYDQS